MDDVTRALVWAMQSLHDDTTSAYDIALRSETTRADEAEHALALALDRLDEVEARVRWLLYGDAV
jgi:hypothetical protein